MPDRYNKHLSVRSSKPKASESDAVIRIRIGSLDVDGRLLAVRSAKVAALLEKNLHDDLLLFLRNIPPDLLEMVQRFCQGYEPQLSSDNVIPLACVASYLEMDERRSVNNLLSQTYKYLQEKVLTSWNETIRALHSSENVINQGVELGLIDMCLGSIISKVLDDPRFLGEPFKDKADTSDHMNRYSPITKLELLELKFKTEELTTLPLHIYEPIIRAMIYHGVSKHHVAASVEQYAKTWVFDKDIGESTSSSNHDKRYIKDAIEAVERLLPKSKGLIPSCFLIKIFELAMEYKASEDCISGFEKKIGEQLDKQVTARDLLKLFRSSYATNAKLGIEFVRRILKFFYSSYSKPGVSGILKVAQLAEEFLCAVAANVVDLRVPEFISISEMVVAASQGACGRNSDVIYRGINIYIGNHLNLTESEKVEVLKVLDLNNLSPSARNHIAKNKRMPLRAVVEVLFATQLQLQDTVMSMEVENSKVEEEEEEEEEEVEKECVLMKEEIGDGCENHRHGEKRKLSVWNEVKKKFGCGNGNAYAHDCDCHVHKKKKMHHPN